jgi:hypothetical protein
MATTYDNNVFAPQGTVKLDRSLPYKGPGRTVKVMECNTYIDFMQVVGSSYMFVGRDYSFKWEVRDYVNTFKRISYFALFFDKDKNLYFGNCDARDYVDKDESIDSLFWLKTEVVLKCSDVLLDFNVYNLSLWSDFLERVKDYKDLKPESIQVTYCVIQSGCVFYYFVPLGDIVYIMTDTKKGMLRSRLHPIFKEMWNMTNVRYNIFEGDSIYAEFMDKCLSSMTHCFRYNNIVLQCDYEELFEPAYNHYFIEQPLSKDVTNFEVRSDYEDKLIKRIVKKYNLNENKIYKAIFWLTVNRVFKCVYITESRNDVEKRRRAATVLENLIKKYRYLNAKHNFEYHIMHFIAVRFKRILSWRKSSDIFNELDMSKFYDKQGCPKQKKQIKLQMYKTIQGVTDRLSDYKETMDKGVEFMDKADPLIDKVNDFFGSGNADKAIGDLMELNKHTQVTVESLRNFNKEILHADTKETLSLLDSISDKFIKGLTMITENGLVNAMGDSFKGVNNFMSSVKGYMESFCEGVCVKIGVDPKSGFGLAIAAFVFGILIIILISIIGHLNTFISTLIKEATTLLFKRPVEVTEEPELQNSCHIPMTHDVELQMGGIELFGALATMVVYLGCGTKPDNPSLPRTVMSWGSLLEGFLDNGKWMICYIAKKFNYDIPLFGDEGVANAAAYCEEMITLVDDPGIYDKITTDANTAERVRNFYGRLGNFRKTLLDPKIYKNMINQQQISAAIRKLEDLYVRARTASPDVHDRMETINVVLLGEPGQGKTIAMKMLPEMIYNSLKEDEETRMLEFFSDPYTSMKCYSKDQNSQYWDKWNNAFFTLINEFLQIKDCNERAPLVAMFMQCSDSCACPLTSPDVNSKGNDFFTSKFMLLTTNVENFNDTGIQDPAGLVRRFSFPFEMIATAPYCDKKNNYEEAWAFKVKKLEGFEGAQQLALENSGLKMGAVYTYTQVVKACVDSFKRKFFKRGGIDTKAIVEDVVKKVVNGKVDLTPISALQNPVSIRKARTVNPVVKQEVKKPVSKVLSKREIFKRRSEFARKYVPKASIAINSTEPKGKEKDTEKNVELQGWLGRLFGVKEVIVPELVEYVDDDPNDSVTTVSEIIAKNDLFDISKVVSEEYADIPESDTKIEQIKLRDAYMLKLQGEDEVRIKACVKCMNNMIDLQRPGSGFVPMKQGVKLSQKNIILIGLLCSRDDYFRAYMRYISELGEQIFKTKFMQMINYVFTFLNCNLGKGIDVSKNNCSFVCGCNKRSALMYVTEKEMEGSVVQASIRIADVRLRNVGEYREMLEEPQKLFSCWDCIEAHAGKEENVPVFENVDGAHMFWSIFKEGIQSNYTFEPDVNDEAIYKRFTKRERDPVWVEVHKEECVEIIPYRPRGLVQAIWDYLEDAMERFCCWLSKDEKSEDRWIAGKKWKISGVTYRILHPVDTIERSSAWTKYTLIGLLGLGSIGLIGYGIWKLLKYYNVLPSTPDFIKPFYADETNLNLQSYTSRYQTQFHRPGVQSRNVMLQAKTLSDEMKDYCSILDLNSRHVEVHLENKIMSSQCWFAWSKQLCMVKHAWELGSCKKLRIFSPHGDTFTDYTPEQFTREDAKDGRDLTIITLDDNQQANDRRGRLNPKPITNIERSIRLSKQIGETGNLSFYYTDAGALKYHETERVTKLGPEGKKQDFKFKNYYLMIGGRGQQGLCGSVVCSHEVRHSNAPIVGIHNAQWGNDSVVTPVFSGDFKPKVEQPEMQCEIVETDIPYEGSWKEEDSKGMPGTEVYKRVKNPKFYVGAQKGELEKSPIHNYLPPEKNLKMPAFLKPTMVNGEMKVPLSSFYSKYQQYESTEKHWFVSEMEKRPDDLFGGFEPSTKDVPYKHRWLTIEEVIFGAPEFGIDCMEGKSSSGFYWKEVDDGKGGTFKKREELWCSETKFIHPLLRQAVDNAIKKIKMGIASAQVVIDALKDELREISRVLMGKTRVFCVGELVTCIIAKMFMGHYLAVMKQHRGESSVGVGANAHNSDWSFMGNHIFKFGRKRVIGGDLPTMDVSTQRYLHRMAFHYLKRRMNLAPGDLIFLEAILYSVVSTVHVSGSWSYIHFKGNSSGNYLTSWFNCFCCFVYISCCFWWVKHNLKIDDDNITFQKCVSLLVYGDDNLGSVAKVAKWFNNKSFAAALKELFGLELTDPNKGAITKEWLDIDEQIFLSRKFVQRDNMFVAPLEEESLWGMLFWLRRSEFVSPMSQLHTNVRVLAQELSHYPEGEANIIWSTVMKALNDIGSAYEGPLPGYWRELLTQGHYKAFEFVHRTRENLYAHVHEQETLID